MEPINIETVLKNINKDKITDLIGELQSLDFESVSIADLKRKIFPLVQCGFDLVTFPKGMHIHRGVLFDYSKPLKNIKQISYNPHPDPSRLNRASTGHHHVFYGSATKVIKEEELAHIAVNFEISQILEPSFDDPFEYIVLGRWYSNIDFRVAVVGLDSTIAQNNSDAIQLKEYKSRIMENRPEWSETMKLVSEFLSREFSKIVKHESEYKTSATFGDLLFDMGVPAIMFPSVGFEGRVFNLAIKKSFVDKFLSCELAAVRKSRNVLGEVVGGYDLISNKINKDGTFNWEDPPLGAMTSNYSLRIVEKEIREKGMFDSGNWIIR